jgi:alpha-amylase/alpha-mannosidase (GH57 family)
MPNQKTKVGDVFWVPIEDGTYVLGQIVEIEKEVLNSITCAFFDVRKDSPENESLDLSAPISIQFVTKDLFNKGTWQRTKNESVQIPENALPYRDTIEECWVGAKVIGSGIICKFLSAFYGLRAWNEMHDPYYYQKLLLPGIKRHCNA